MGQNRLPGLPARILYGGDYNPDQWLDCPDILAEDLELMKKAHVNCVTLGVFAWSRLEPEEGRYDFDWLQKIMDDLYANGIYTILSTPTGAMPRWLTDRYEEVNKVEPNGLRRHHGVRHNFCPSSPVLREKAQAIDRALSQRFGRHPGLIAWHISNEYGGDHLEAACHCPHCQAAFREWVRARYGTLDAVNHAWWTAFWSHTITDWEQIRSPSPLGEVAMHGLKLDWKRFVSDQTLSFCRGEIAAVREFSDAPATINAMGTFMPLNYFRWAEHLDFISEDSYPVWHSGEDELDTACGAAFVYSLIRSAKRQPFLLMESVPSAVSWAPRCTLKRPGMLDLSSLQAVAHGSNSVQYFQWRKGRGANEKYHGAVVDHKNGENTRVFREVSALGERLEKLGRLTSTCSRPKAALVFDWENWWAVEDAEAVVRPLNYVERLMPWFRAFWERGIDVDIVDMDRDLDRYSLVVAPVNYMYRGSYIGRVRDFVQNGGTYVTTYWSGEVDDTDLCFLGEHPLRELLGVRTEEIDVRPLHTENFVEWDGREYPVRDLCALVHAESAQMLGTYRRDFYAGYPALTRNAYGKGTSWFVAAECEPSFIGDLYDKLLSETGVGCTLKADLPAGATVSERVDEEGRSLWFVQNFNAAPAPLALHETYTDAETGGALSGAVELAPYQCLILERAN